MKKVFFLIILLTLLLAPITDLHAQTNDITETKDLSFKHSDTTQWVKDMRRFDIIAFGTFPFTMFLATFFYDCVLWYNANRMDFSSEGRRYAPWPFRSAGGPGHSSRDYQRMFLTAVGISCTFALTDLIITISKRNKEKRRLESLPSSTYEIERLPYGDPPVDEPVQDENLPDTGTE